MSKKQLDNSGKWMISVWMIVLFIIIASPFMFKIVNQLVELVGLPSIADGDGRPNMYGLVLHGIVFGILVRAMMEFKLPGVQ